MAGKPITDQEPLLLSTGYAVHVRKVGPYTREAIARSLPRPTPPLVAADYGDGTIVREPNDADPDYIAAIAAWEIELQTRSVDVLLRLGVVAEIDQAALDDVKAIFEITGLEFPADEKLGYIRHVLIGCDADLVHLAAAITGISQPTEGAVADHAATFPGDIQG